MLARFELIELLCFCSCIQQTLVATNTVIAAQILTRCFSTERDNVLTVRPSVYPETLDLAILKSVQDKLIIQGHKKTNHFFSQSLIPGAKAKKEKKNYGRYDNSRF